MGNIRSILVLCKIAGAFPYDASHGAIPVQPPWVAWTVMYCLVVATAAAHLLLQTPALTSSLDISNMADVIWVCTYTLCFLVSTLYTACTSAQLALIFRMMKSLNHSTWMEGKGSSLNAYGVKVYAPIALLFTSMIGIGYGLFQIPMTLTNGGRIWYTLCYGIIWLLAGFSCMNSLFLFFILTWELKTLNHSIVSEHLLEKFAPQNRRELRTADRSTISTIHGGRAGRTPPTVSRAFEIVSEAPHASRDPETHSARHQSRDQLFMVDQLLLVEDFLIRINETVEQLMRYFSLMLMVISLALCSAVTVFCYFLIDEYLSTGKMNWIYLYAVVFATGLYIAMNLGPDRFNAQVS